MAASLHDGRLIDAIVALLVIEALLLTAVRALLGRGPSIVSTLANSSAGVALFLALRAAIAEAPFAVIGACLFAALLAHIADLTTRWRGAPRAREVCSSPSSSSAALAPESSRV